MAWELQFSALIELPKAGDFLSLRFPFAFSGLLERNWGFRKLTKSSFDPSSEIAEAVFSEKDSVAQET